MSGRSTYQEAAPFVAASPRPKLRKPSKVKPGAKAAPELILHVLEDRSRGVCLVRGKGVGAMLDTAGIQDSARWSEWAKGWVLDAGDLADLIAVAEHSRAPISMRKMGGAQ